MTSPLYVIEVPDYISPRGAEALRDVVRNCVGDETARVLILSGGMKLTIHDDGQNLDPQGGDR